MNLRRVFLFFTIGAALQSRQPTQLKATSYYDLKRLHDLQQAKRASGKKGTFAVRTLRALAGTNWQQR